MNNPSKTEAKYDENEAFQNVKFILIADPAHLPDNPEDIDLALVPGQDPRFVSEGSWSSHIDNEYHRIQNLLDSDYLTFYGGAGGPSPMFEWKGDTKLNILGILFYQYPVGEPGYQCSFQVTVMADGYSTNMGDLRNPDYMPDQNYDGLTLVTFDPIATSYMMFRTANHEPDTSGYLSHHDNAIIEFRLLYDKGTPFPEDKDFTYLITPEGGSEQAVVPGSEIELEAGKKHDISYRLEQEVLQPSEISLQVNGVSTGESSATGYTPKEGDELIYTLTFSRGSETILINPVIVSKVTETSENQWKPGTTYNSGDIVSNNGIVFESRVNHISCIDCGGPGFEQQWSVVKKCGTIDESIYPVWNETSQYSPIDAIVYHSGKLYQAKQEGQVGLRPDATGLEWAWEDLSLKGVVL